MKKYTFGTVRNFDRAKAEESRTIPFVISSADRDRHKSRLNMNGWDLENYALNPIVGYQHDVYGDNMCQPNNPDNVIGSGRVFLEDNLLIGETTFETKDINPLAEKIFQKVLRGTLRATSVGFLEIGQGKVEKEKIGEREEETYFFSGQELLEYSIVNIPSNAKAVGRTMPNHVEQALGYLMNFMPEDISMRDLKGMKIQEVMDIVAGKVEEKFVAKTLGKSKGIFERKLKMIESEINN